MFLQAATVLDKIRHVIYVSQSQLLFAKINEDRTISRKALYIYACIFIFYTYLTDTYMYIYYIARKAFSNLYNSLPVQFCQSNKLQTNQKLMHRLYVSTQ